MKKALLAAALAVPAAFPAGMSTAAGERAGSAAPNGLLATAKNTTPADEVGRSVVVRVSGRITGASSAVAKRCRSNRAVQTKHVKLSGAKYGNDFYDTSRLGRFKGDFPLEYGGTDPSDGRFYDGDVDFGGGTVKFTLVIPKTQIDVHYKLRTCRQLTTTLQINVPPSNVVTSAMDATAR
jgi:hypothetical protein